MENGRNGIRNAPQAVTLSGTFRINCIIINVDRVVNV